MRTARAHEAVAAVVGEGDWVVDATAGNGHDTLFLAGQVGTSGHVWAFDVQATALGSTRQRLESAGVAERVTLVEASHASMKQRLPDSATARLAAVMFNLGYLPGSDKRVVTTPKETLQALDAALALLRPGGVLSLMVYRGHPGGRQEWLAVRDWQGRCSCPVTLDGDPAPDATAPILLVIEKFGC